jgi:hypothetical protein
LTFNNPHVGAGLPGAKIGAPQASVGTWWIMPDDSSVDFTRGGPTGMIRPHQGLSIVFELMIAVLARRRTGTNESKVRSMSRSWIANGGRICASQI